jgi:hypothetical protein
MRVLFEGGSHFVDSCSDLFRSGERERYGAVERHRSALRPGRPECLGNQSGARRGDGVVMFGAWTR